MSKWTWMKSALVVVALAAPWLSAADKPLNSKVRPKITWKKTVIDTKFRSEGVAIADVNRDGKMDILAGDVWYEAPHWKMHEIRKPKRDYGNGAQGYSETFACWAEDINGDGYPDLIVIGFPGAPCHWYENPKGKPGHWKEHVIWHSACNETPLFVDLFGTGQRVLVMAFQPKGKDNLGQMAWFAPGKDPTKLWEMHSISRPSTEDKTTTTTHEANGARVTVAVTIHGKVIPGTFRYAHGLGVGDVNGDGKLDVICTGGWWEQPAKLSKRPWRFHSTPIGDSCADMFAFDMDGDGKADIISSSAHDYGIWWHQQRIGADGKRSFIKKNLFPRLVSQTHALHFVDINGDGQKDLVTGKRWWAHGPRGDADPNAPATLYWFEARKNRQGLTQFIPHLIDKDSGIGTQFVVADFNGDKLPDIVVSNKKGVFVFEQMRNK